MTLHKKFILRCIELAKNGLGKTYPNPMVGSVVVHNNRIIGEGWHQKAGEAHAEVNAINSVADKSLLGASTIYVSLEPCSHYGKTPPCSDLIISSGIRNVIIGTLDPFAKVAGRGIKKLLDAGCQVNVGVLENECQDVNRRFFTFHQKKRPYVILKWAESFDGFLAPTPTGASERKPVWITNSISQQLVHKWRAEEQAILIGTNTAVADNPSLTTRNWYGSHPARFVLDQQLRIPRDSFLFDGSSKTVILTTASENVREEFTTSGEGEKISFEVVAFNENLAFQICDLLFEKDLQSLIIEGGGRTLKTFINAGLWDEARIFKGNLVFGSGTRSPEISGKLYSERVLQGDILKIFRND